MVARRLGTVARIPDLDDVTYGLHAIAEALASGEKLRRIHIGHDRKRDPAVRKLVESAERSGIPVRYEERRFFSTFPFKAHQSVVAYGEPFHYASLGDVLARRAPGHPLLLVILDHVTDPHNAGAIIRTAEACGADGVVLPERRSAGVNATVRKAAAGATAHLPVVRVANIAQVLRTLKKAHLWVAGAALTGGALPYSEADFSGDLALVIGAEGAGISPLVARECDYLVKLPMLGAVASLNASVAAAVLLYEAVRQRRPSARSR